MNVPLGFRSAFLGHAPWYLLCTGAPSRTISHSRILPGVLRASAPRSVPSFLRKLDLVFFPRLCSWPRSRKVPSGIEDFGRKIQKKFTTFLRDRGLIFSPIPMKSSRGGVLGYQNTALRAKKSDKMNKTTKVIKCTKQPK